MTSDMGPRVSVIVPTLPTDRHLTECLRSIAQQDHRPEGVQVIAVVAGSDETVLTTARDILSSHPGPAEVVASDAVTRDQAWAHGLSFVEAPWVTRVDAEDWVTSQFLTEMLRAAGKNQVAVSAVMEVDDTGAEALAETVRDLIDAPNLAAVSDVAPALATMRGALFPTIRARSVLATADTPPTARLVADAIASEGRTRVVETRPAKSGATYVARVGRSSGRHAPAVRVQDLLLGYGRDASYVPPKTDQLAVVYNFAPFTDASAAVAVRRLRASEQPWNVISATMVNLRERDASLSQIAAPAVAQHHLTTGPAAFGSWPAIESFCLQGLEMVAEIERTAGAQRVLYSRAYGVASHLLAALVKHHAGERIRWTAEFSDPLRKDVHGRERTAPAGGPLTESFREILLAAGIVAPESPSVFQWGELLPAVLADEIVFLHPHQLDYVTGYQEDPAVAELLRSKAVLWPHPQPEGALYLPIMGEPLAAETVHIGYFGSFYRNRGIGEVVTALQTCDPSVRERVRLHVFSAETPELKEVADSLDGLLIRHDPLPYGEYLRTLRRFDVLLVNDVDTSDQPGRVNPYLPSKLSDYRGAGVPIWALVEPGSMLAQAACSYQSRIGDLAGAVEVVERVVAEHGFDRSQASGVTGSGPQSQRRRPWSWLRRAR